MNSEVQDIILGMLIIANGIVFSLLVIMILLILKLSPIDSWNFDD